MRIKETYQTIELADLIVEKFRALVVLECKVLEAREAVRQSDVVRNNSEPSNPQESHIVQRQEMLTELELQLKELQLKEGVAEMEKIMDELELAAPDFRTYVLPQISEIVATLKSSDIAEQEEFAQLVTALVEAGSSQSLERLESIIITRLRDNLEKIFGI